MTALSAAPAHMDANRRPRLLDLCAGAGGGAMGYWLAGFEVVGVDIRPQPHYPFAFHQADALEFPMDGFDAVHASPPCQRYTRGAKRAGTAERHPDLIAPIRERLLAAGIPWVIENVPGSPLRSPITLCGEGLGLGVFRHRWFEASFPLAPPLHPTHRGRIGDGRFVTVAGNAGGSSHRDGWKDPGVAGWRTAMGIDWPMTVREIREAIPPAYTEWIGRRLRLAATREGVAW